MNTDCNPCGTYFTTEELVNQTVICDGGSVSFQVVGMSTPEPPDLDGEILSEDEQYYIVTEDELSYIQQENA